MGAEKYDFMRTETKYLGRVVSAEGIKPDPAAVSKIQDWMSPREKEELQSFLGFANYYREFSPFHGAKIKDKTNNSTRMRSIKKRLTQ